MNARTLTILTILSLVFRGVAQQTPLDLGNRVTLAKTNRATHDDIRRLLAVTQADTQLESLLPQILDQVKRALPDVPATEWRQLETGLKPDELLALVIPIYERHLTTDEIKGLIAFYETPLGKKLVEKLPIITKESMQAGMEWGEKLVARVQTKSAATNTQPAANWPLNAKQKATALRARGFDPDLYDIDDNTADIVKRPQPTVVKIPSRYWIDVKNGNSSIYYYSDKKPKQSGGSYIIQDIRGFEVTVSGNVTIIDGGEQK